MSVIISRDEKHLMLGRTITLEQTRFQLLVRSKRDVTKALRELKALGGVCSDLMGNNYVDKGVVALTESLFMVHERMLTEMQKSLKNLADKEEELSRAEREYKKLGSKKSKDSQSK